MRHKSIKYIIILSIGLLGVCPFVFLTGKPVHISIDDVALKEIYSFNERNPPLLQILMECHRTTGGVFTLYVYSKDAKEISKNTWAEYSGTLCLDRVKPLLSQSLLGAEPSR